MQITVHWTLFQYFVSNILILNNWMITHQHWLIHKWGHKTHIWWHINALRANMSWLMTHLHFPRRIYPAP